MSRNPSTRLSFGRHPDKIILRAFLNKVHVPKAFLSQKCLSFIAFIEVYWYAKTIEFPFFGRNPNFLQTFLFFFLGT